MQKNKVTVVILTKNEEKTIGEIIKGIRPHVDTIVVIDGHSKDKTRDVVGAEGVSVYLDEGKGKGCGIRYAIDTIESDILVFIDADGSHDPKDIPEMVKPLIDGKADLVVGSRMRGGSDELYGTIEQFFRLMGSQLITLAINYRFGVKLTDSQNGFRAIKSSVARQLGLKENITTIEQEMTIKALKNGFKVDEIVSHEYARKHGESNIKLWKVSHRYIWCLLKNIF